MDGEQAVNKFGAKKTTVAGIVFDSKAEARRYGELLILERAGYICGLERQPVYVLAPAVMIGGRKKPALRYKADFRYWDHEAERMIIEDVKGVVTPLFRVKQHLMATVHGIEVVVIA